MKPLKLFIEAKERRRKGRLSFEKALEDLAFLNNALDTYIKEGNELGIRKLEHDFINFIKRTHKDLVERAYKEIEKSGSKKFPPARTEFIWQAHDTDNVERDVKTYIKKYIYLKKIRGKVIDKNLPRTSLKEIIKKTIKKVNSVKNNFKNGMRILISKIRKILMFLPHLNKNGKEIDNWINGNH